MKRMDLALSQLVVNPLINHRHGDSGDVSGLVAQIRSRGFVDPLWVRRAPVQGKGKAKKTAPLYEVIDGSRRLRALRQVAASLKISTIPCDCFTVSNEEAVELALAAHLEHESLSPADEARAFAALKLGGITVSEIAGRYAKSERLVQQRIAIGTLAPEILAALREGEIDIRTAQAFTLTPSAERQKEVFAKLHKRRALGALGAHAVRDEIAGKGSIPARHGRALLVGLDAYRAAGGKLNEDLFGDQSVLADAKLLGELFAAEVEKRVKALKAEGWAWVKLLEEKGWNNTEHTYPTVAARGERHNTKEEKQALAALAAQRKALDLEAAGLDAKDQRSGLTDSEQEHRADLAEEIDALEALTAARTAAPYTPAQKSRLGVLIHVTEDDCAILLGRQTPQEGKAGAKKKTAGKSGPDPDGGGAEDGETGDGMADVSHDIGYSDALHQVFLVAARNDCKLALSQKPALAARLGLAHRIFDVIIEGYGAPFIVTRHVEPGGGNHDHAMEAARAIFEGCESFASVVAKLETLDALTAGHLDALCSACILKFESLGDADVRAVMALIDPLIGAEGFRVDADLLSRCNREQLSLIAVECGREVPKVKKPEMVAALLPALTETGWLPAPLRTPSYTGPGSDGWKPAAAASSAAAGGSLPEGAAGPMPAPEPETTP